MTLSYQSMNRRISNKECRITNNSNGKTHQMLLKTISPTFLRHSLFPARYSIFYLSCNVSEHNVSLHTQLPSPVYRVRKKGRPMASPFSHQAINPNEMQIRVYSSYFPTIEIAATFRKGAPPRLWVSPYLGLSSCLAPARPWSCRYIS